MRGIVEHKLAPRLRWWQQARAGACKLESYTLPTWRPSPPLFVTQPALPDLPRFVAILEEVWASKTITNAGPLTRRLETLLSRHLGVEHLSLFSSGTFALMAALKALDVEGEVITTPFSFVATSHVLRWGRLRPVFADIDPHTLNLDPGKIEAAITLRTTAILAVHCYGTPCDVDAIGAIARRRGLKVIYDAAHAFGVRCHCGSILEHGDLSVLSFHATKVFSTIEGGAVVSRNRATKERLDRLGNFGFSSETTVVETGINGKMNELEAAFGICQLEQIGALIARRAEIDARYRQALSGVPGIRCLPIKGASQNHGYFPIFVGNGYPLSRDELYNHLKSLNIHARRYFFPLISDFPMYRDLPSAAPGNLPVAHQAADQVLCLPIFPAMSAEDQERVIEALLGA